MKVTAILIAAIASVHGGSMPRGWTTTQAPGWPSTTTTGWPSTTTGWPSTTTGWPSTTTGWPSTTTGWPSTTTGWPSTTTGWPSTTTGWPSTTQGWTTPGWGGHKGWGPSTTQGWGQNPGWGHNTNVEVAADLAATGSGWSAQNHAEQINVAGSGWNPAQLTAEAGGEAYVEQSGEILQAAQVNNDGASSVNTVAVSNTAEADEGLTVAASGDDIAVLQSGWAASSGEGGVGAAADSSLNISGQSGWKKQ